MDKNKLEQSRQIIRQVQDRIKTSNNSEALFFLEKAHHSFETSQRLLELIKTENLNSHMWVINSSYYSMFFAVVCFF